MILDPVTRIEGHMGVHIVVDTDERRVVEAHSYATMFRGFEIILKGRDPADAVFITPRICGVCSVPHALASAMACDMALKASPPPLAVELRNLAYIAEMIYDNAIHLFQLAGPDYSEKILSKFNREWLEKARDFTCENSDWHGKQTVLELVKGLNPFTGDLYVYALKMEREARKLAALIGAKHPHVNTFVPGGVSRTWRVNEAIRALSILSSLMGLAKLTVKVWEDLSRFLYGLGYSEAGSWHTNLLCYGAIEDSRVYNAEYSEMDDWSIKRVFTPGVVVNGELVTTSLKEINLGVREYCSHSFYSKWRGEFNVDPEGNALSPYHEWNKETIVDAKPKDFNGKYSWGYAPRWEGRNGEYALEAGPIARLYVSALAGKSKFENKFSSFKSGNREITVELPETRSEEVPSSLRSEATLKWSVPERVNVIERLKARAFNLACYAAAGLEVITRIMELLRRGETALWREFERPGFSMGVGLVEASRGALGHWIVVKNGVIHRYQVVTPTCWNISPMDDKGVKGPLEQALEGTPITEDHGEPEEWVGLDPMRVVRSYDPCLACSVHAHFKGVKVVKIG